MNAPLADLARAGTDAPLVAFQRVSKSYDGRTAAVAELDLSVAPGEFLTLLGPSGSGKTTTLMMLAGFEQPSGGQILLRGQSLANRPPHRRNMGVVFQNYALFPHMTVAENLGFPLGVRGIRGTAARTRVDAALGLVQLGDFGDRRPAQLSGGQQQRVALARALIFEPDIVLMDEPLGALDRQLREVMQDEIKRIHRQLGITVVYVTHDQSEALALSDRIAIFDRGEVQQVGDPRTIYDRPANGFVATFVGENNAIPGRIAALAGGECTARIEGGHSVRATAVGTLAPGDAVLLTVRPEQVRTGPGLAAANRFAARVEDSMFHGDRSRVRARLDGGIEIWFPAATPPRPGEALEIGWNADACMAFPELRR